MKNHKISVIIDGPRKLTIKPALNVEITNEEGVYYATCKELNLEAVEDDTDQCMAFICMNVMDIWDELINPSKWMPPTKEEIYLSSVAIEEKR